MKLSLRSILLPIFFLLALLLGSCTQNDEESIVGSWASVDKTAITRRLAYTFEKDGIMQFTEHDREMKVVELTGTYAIRDSEIRIKYLHEGIGAGRTVFHFIVENDRLYLSLEKDIDVSERDANDDYLVRQPPE